jgi:hypothetical protein
MTTGDHRLIRSLSALHVARGHTQNAFADLGQRRPLRMPGIPGDLKVAFGGIQVALLAIQVPEDERSAGRPFGGIRISVKIT